MLSDRQRAVLELYYGLHGNQSKTLKEIGDLFGITRERVRQILAQAYKRIRVTGALRAQEDPRLIENIREAVYQISDERIRNAILAYTGINDLQPKNLRSAIRESGLDYTQSKQVLKTLEDALWKIGYKYQDRRFVKLTDRDHAFRNHFDTELWK